MFGLVIVSTIICTLVGLVGQFFFDRDPGKMMKWLGFSLLGNFALNLILVYLIMPALTGPLGGYQYLLIPLIINACFAGMIWLIKSSTSYDSETTPRQGETVGSTAAICLLLVVMFFITWATNWTNAAGKYKANIMPVTPALADTFPSTDTEHLPMVPLSHAMAKGSRALTQSGQNLGSIYRPGTYSLQNVANHLYWVAPLLYQNVFANLANQVTPGYVVVDAENPDADAVLKTDHPIHYMPEALFNQDVVRHAYLNGYSGYRLMDPTLECDDEWNCFFTLDASHFVAGFTGTYVEKVLVINAETGEITPYTFVDKPAWVDRVIPLAAIQEYVDWYGNWANANFWWNWSGKNREMSANDTAPIAWSSLDQSPVAQFEMTSQNTSDFASTGILLVDTNELRATRYPIFGIAVGSQVSKAFNDTPGNKVYQYPHTNPILVKIFDRLTWFTVYVADSSDTAMFVGVGLMDAEYTGPNNVIMATSKEEALARYHQWVTNRPSNTTDVSGS
ncbi:MAG: hypothetical protein ACD_61C00048G0001, partial [uncultured bacterium]